MLRSIVAAVLLLLLGASSPASGHVATLEVAPLDGGSRTLVARTDKVSNGFIGVAWAPDSASLLAIGESPSGRYLTPVLRRHPATGAGAAQVAAPLTGVIEASVAPDGATVTETFDQGFATRRGGVLVRDVASGAIRARVAQVAQGDDLYEDPPMACWSHDGARVAIAAVERRGRTLRVFDVRTGTQLLWARRTTPIGAQCFSPGGSQLLAGRESRRDDETSGIVDVASGRFRPLPRWNRDLDDAAWSPDGTRIAVAGDSDIAIVDPATGWGPSYPAADFVFENFGALRWSPDGGSLAYLVHGDEWSAPTRLAVVSVAPPAPPRVLVDPRRSSVAAFAWSPDSRRIAFSAYRFDFPLSTGGRGR